MTKSAEQPNPKIQKNKTRLKPGNNRSIHRGNTRLGCRQAQEYNKMFTMEHKERKVQIHRPIKGKQVWIIMIK